MYFFFLEIQGNNVQNWKIELADGINKGVGHWESETTQTDQHRREFDAADTLDSIMTTRGHA